MKTIKSFFIFCSLSVLLISCGKDDTTSTTATISTAAIISTATSGNWRITYYYDTDHEETTNYSGYVFTFSANNVVTAVKNGQTVSGTWGTRIDDSKTKLDLNFTTPTVFVELSDDWHVIERTDTKVKLQDVSGGNGGTDYLTFEKN